MNTSINNNTSQHNNQYFLPSTHGRETEARWGKIESVGKSMCLLFLWTLGMGGGAELRGQTTSVGEETHRFSKIHPLSDYYLSAERPYEGDTVLKIYEVVGLQQGITETKNGFLLWTISRNPKYRPSPPVLVEYNPQYPKNEREKALLLYKEPGEQVELFSYSRSLRERSYDSLSIQGGEIGFPRNLESSFIIGQKLYLVLNRARFSFVIGEDSLRVPLNPRTKSHEFEEDKDGGVLLVIDPQGKVPPKLIPPKVEGKLFRRFFIRPGQDKVWLVSDKYSPVDQPDTMIRQIIIAQLGEQDTWEVDTIMPYGWRNREEPKDGIFATIGAIIPISDQHLIVYGGFQDSVMLNGISHTFEEALAKQYPNVRIRDSLLGIDYRNGRAGYVISWVKDRGISQVETYIGSRGGHDLTLGTGNSMYGYGYGNPNYLIATDDSILSKSREYKSEFVIKISPTLQHDWARRFRHASSYGRHREVGLCPDRQGGVWVFGQAFDSLWVGSDVLTSAHPNVVNSYLIHLDQNGHLLHAELFDSPGYVEFREMVPVGKKSYALFGLSTSPPEIKEGVLSFSAPPQNKIRAQTFITIIKVK